MHLYTLVLFLLVNSSRSQLWDKSIAVASHSHTLSLRIFCHLCFMWSREGGVRKWDAPPSRPLIF